MLWLMAMGWSMMRAVTMYFDPVGDAPPVAQDDAVSIYEDVETTIIQKEALLGNDTDIDRDVSGNLQCR